MLKKFTIFAFALLACVTMNAQTTVFSENFDEVETPNSVGVLPSDWFVYDVDGLTPINLSPMKFITNGWNVINFVAYGKVATSTSYYDPAGQSNDWMVTPQITVPATNGFLFYDVAALDSDYPDNYEVLISTTGHTPEDFTTVLKAENAPAPNLVTRVISLQDYAGQDVYIAFRNVANDKFILVMDNISVQSLISYDLEAVSLNVSHIMEASDVIVKSTLKNKGANVITSFDATWVADGGDEHTQTVSGVQIQPWQTYNFSATDHWDAQAGDHVLTVTVSNINGNGPDDNVDNDTVTKNISVATSTVQRKPLYEEFTSSTCGPCASFNGPIFTPYLNGLDASTYSLVKYQVNWPGAGDPYYTAEVGVRVDYYGINAAPTLLLGGSDEPSGSISGLQSNFNARNNVPSFFDMAMEATFTDPQVSATVNITPYVSGEFTLYAAVIEKKTTQNTATNGETSFENVMMKMMPNAEGTTVQLTSGVPMVSNLAAVNMTTTHMEEFSDLAVVVFLEDPITKTILQSAHSANPTAVVNHEMDNLKMYPNPSNGVLRITCENPVNVKITDVTGKYVFGQNNVSSDQTLDITSLNSGVYFVTMTREASVTTKKLVIR